MNDKAKEPSKENPSNVGLVCAVHAPKAGMYSGQEASSFLGKYVKKAFKAFVPTSGRETLEHMWIKVLEVKDGTLSGTLDNDPIWITEVQFGDTVTLTVDEIEDVAD